MPKKKSKKSSPKKEYEEEKKEKDEQLKIDVEVVKDRREIEINQVKTSYFQTLLLSLKDVSDRNEKNYENKLRENYRKLSLNVKKKRKAEIPLTPVNLSNGIISAESSLITKYFTLPLQITSAKTKDERFEIIHSLSRDYTNVNIEWSIEIIDRIISSSNRILESIKEKRMYWDNNIIVVKAFRSNAVASYDEEVLTMLFNKFKSFSYSIAETPYDTFSLPKLNRQMLSIDDSSIQQTPILMEIYYAILLSLKATKRDQMEKDLTQQQQSKSSNPASLEETKESESRDNEDAIDHELESFSFLFSSKNGTNQKPHIDYSYDVTKLLDLSDAFFHPEMSYSFLYALQDDTHLHFLNPSNHHEKITIYLNQGDLLLWSGQQVHFGGKYLNSNLRLFGSIRSKGLVKKENEFYWYDTEKGLNISSEH